MNLGAWHDLFLGSVGAASALAGLIIVAMSVNITTILAIPSMTSRAATTIATLILVVIVGCAGLVPDQPIPALGAETVTAAGIALLLAARSAGHIFRTRPQPDGPVLNVGKAALGVVPTAGVLAGGILLCAESSVGLPVLAAAVITGFATSTTNAWVLLVEIRR